MNNPYQPVAVPVDDTRRSRGSVRIGVMVGALGLGLVALNYATATSGGWWLGKTFIHALFLSAPLAWAVHAAQLLQPLGRLGRMTVLGLAAVALASFGLSLLAWFSSNPFEQFTVQSQYFGRAGWIHWAWLICTGLLPLVTLTITNRRICHSISLIVILAYLHLAYCVWQTSHLALTEN